MPNFSDETKKAREERRGNSAISSDLEPFLTLLHLNWI